MNALGHAHPRWTRATSEQAGKLAHLSNLFDPPLQEAFAERLAPACGLDLVFFSNSGTEAVECGLKMARRWRHDRGERKRTSIPALSNAFHGRTLGSLSCTYNESHRRPISPLLPDVDFAPADDLASLEKALRSGRFAVLLVEPIQGESGVLPLPLLFLQEIRRITRQTGTLLFFDEVQSGGGRTGSFLASQRAGVLPDIVALRKPIGAGFPVGATVASREVGGCLKPGDHGSTSGGGPLACKAGLVFMEELLDRGLLEHADPGLRTDPRFSPTRQVPNEP